MLPVDVLYATQNWGWWESDETNFLKPDGQSRNLNVYDINITGHYNFYHDTTLCKNKYSE